MKTVSLIAIVCIIGGIWLSMNGHSSPTSIVSSEANVAVSNTVIGSTSTSRSADLDDLLLINFEVGNDTAHFPKSTQQELDAAVSAVDELSVALFAQENVQATQSSPFMPVEMAAFDEASLHVERMTEEQMSNAVQQLEDNQKKLNEGIR